MNSNRAYAITAIVLVLSLSLASSTACFYYQSEQYKSAYDGLVKDKIFVNIGIDYSNGTHEWYNDTIAPSNITAFRATMLVAEVNYTLYSFGPFITGINGVEANDSSYWALYYNGEYSPVGAGALVLLAGDTINWVLTVF